MSNPKSNTLRWASLIALLIALILIVLQLAGYFKANQQLASLLVPQSTRDKVAHLRLTLAAIAFIPFIAALFFHRRYKYYVAIIFCILSILVPKLYIIIMGR